MVHFAKNKQTNKLLYALAISVAVCLVLGFIFRFRFSSYTNDDYNISLLISNGDYYTFFVNVILSYFLTVTQKSLPEINCFVFIQYIGCFASMTIFNYVFLKKYKAILGVLFSIIVSAFIFVYNILFVQFTHTSTTVFVAGAALCLSLCLYEQRKIYKILQAITAALMMIFSSMIRFEPFIICSFLFGIAITLLCALSYRFYKESCSSIINKIMSSVKKCSIIIFTFLISIGSAVGLLCLSNAISSNNAYINEMKEYNAARAAVVDYDIIPYDGNEEFYNSLDINSNEELSMITFDKEKYDTVTLNKIAEKSSEVLYGGDSKLIYVVKSTVNRVYSVVKDFYRNIIKAKEKFHISVSNKVFMLLVLAIFFVIIIGLILTLRQLNKKSLMRCTDKNIFLSIFIVLIWIGFFLIVKINNNNNLFVALFAIILFSMICKSCNWWTVYCFSLIPMLIYLYQMNFRMSLRVVYTFIFPTIVFMIILLDEKKLSLNRSISPIQLWRFGLAISLACISFSMVCIWFITACYPKYTKDYDNQLRQYMESHSNEVFVIDIHNNYLVDEGYYNSLIKPNIPHNEIVTSGWIMITNYFQDSLKSHNIENLIFDMINSKGRLVIVENDSSSIQDQANQYEEFYNTHYYNGKQVISLQLDEELSCYDNLNQETKVGIYKVAQK